MALIRFNDQAFNWDRVYAFRVEEHETYGHVKRLSVFCDIPGSTVGAPTLELTGSFANDAWIKAGMDGRFKKFHALPRFFVSLDLEKVQAVAVNADGKSGTVVIELEKNRGGAFEVGHGLAQAILQSL